MTASLYDHFAALARAQPDAPALVSDDSGLSRRQWLALVDHTARQFEVDGLGAGQRIGWLGHNRHEMLAALLACAKLGAVWVPLNWRLSPIELASQVRHAGLSALTGTPELAGLAAQVLALAPCAGHGGDPAQPGDVMLVYTSGSSAAPKGAVHSQAGMLANLSMATAVQDLGVSDRVLAVLPGRVVDQAGLRAHLALHLARFKLPRELDLAKSLSRTALGKVQKGLLRRQMGWGEPD